VHKIAPQIAEKAATPTPPDDRADHRVSRGRRIAGLLAESFVFRRGRRLWALNVTDWSLPLTKVDKAFVGLYLILSDYARGIFPPTFHDQQAAYQNEIDYQYAIPGMSLEEFNVREIRKPFWDSKTAQEYLDDFLLICREIERAGLAPDRGRILEIGCGTGWMAELLALQGHSVTATSLAPFEITLATRRLEALRVKGVNPKLKYVVAAMEGIHQSVDELFNFVFIYQALHHAFSWQETFRSTFQVLEPGGRFYVCAEPNLAHTFVAYRGTKKLKTHEIGLSRGAMISELKAIGFTNIRCTRNKFNNLISYHWIVAQKPGQAPTASP
jgi:2-polyprenyl-3-methyl-5-hydroxy-6-metoxy-1,4-benzoquinol methylase